MSRRHGRPDLGLVFLFGPGGGAVRCGDGLLFRVTRSDVDVEQDDDDTISI